VTLDAAYAANPSRFAGRPTPPKLPTVAWINEPQEALIQNV
jgi:putative transposase